jgi:hypothetical protein
MRRCIRYVVFVTLFQESTDFIERSRILHFATYFTFDKYLQGPEFEELAEDLQASFENYVKEECGVDDDVTAFISMYCDYREQEEYVSFMKTAVEILD